MAATLSDAAARTLRMIADRPGAIMTNTNGPKGYNSGSAKALHRRGFVHDEARTPEHGFAAYTVTPEGAAALAAHEAPTDSLHALAAECPPLAPNAEAEAFDAKAAKARAEGDDYDANAYDAASARARARAKADAGARAADVAKAKARAEGAAHARRTTAEAAKRREARAETVRERFERVRAAQPLISQAKAERAAEADPHGVGVVAYHADTDAGEGMGAERFGVRIDGRYNPENDFATRAGAEALAGLIIARRTRTDFIDERDADAASARGGRLAAVRAYVGRIVDADPADAGTRARAFTCAAGEFRAMAEHNGERMHDGCKRNYIAERNCRKAAAALARSAECAEAEARGL